VVYFTPKVVVWPFKSSLLSKTIPNDNAAI
jgi:hypothetical protein